MKYHYVLIAIALLACGPSVGPDPSSTAAWNTAGAGETATSTPVAAPGRGVATSGPAGAISTDASPSPSDTTDLPPLPASASRSVDGAAVTIRVLAVTSRSGGGDAILVADSAAVPARHVLIDAGDDDATADALRRLGVDSLDLMILTHAHHDHYGGMSAVLDAVPVRAFAFNGQVRTAVTYRRLLEKIEERVPVVITVDSLRRVRLGADEDATVITLIPPLGRHLHRDTNDGQRLNEESLAVRVERGTFSFLTTGDAEKAANEHFASRFADLVDVDVLKVGHHGSTDATQQFWLEATTPEVAVVSANGTTHPHGPVLRMLERQGIELYCTPQHGMISIRVATDGAFAVQTAESPRNRCLPGGHRE